MDQEDDQQKLDNPLNKFTHTFYQDILINPHDKTYKFVVQKNKKLKLLLQSFQDCQNLHPAGTMVEETKDSFTVMLSAHEFPIYDFLSLKQLKEIRFTKGQCLHLMAELIKYYIDCRNKSDYIRMSNLIIDYSDGTYKKYNPKSSIKIKMLNILECDQLCKQSQFQIGHKELSYGLQQIQKLIFINPNHKDNEVAQKIINLIHQRMTLVYQQILNRNLFQAEKEIQQIIQEFTCQKHKKLLKICVQNTYKCQQCFAEKFEMDGGQLTIIQKYAPVYEFTKKYSIPLNHIESTKYPYADQIKEKPQFASMFIESRNYESNKKNQTKFIMELIHKYLGEVKEQLINKTQLLYEVFVRTLLEWVDLRIDVSFQQCQHRANQYHKNQIESQLNRYTFQFAYAQIDREQNKKIDSEQLINQYSQDLFQFCKNIVKKQVDERFKLLDDHVNNLQS